jgi:outer membrane receptor for ferrienterochelin and colicins
MKRFLLLLFVFSISMNLSSQNTFRAVIKDADSGEILAGATGVLQGTSRGSIADEKGNLEINDIPDGEHVIIFRYIGYIDKTATYIFPVVFREPVEVLLVSRHEELEEVFISSTRGSRTIENIPARIELIAGEELEEKGNMKPGDIRMMLNESTGIQTQQTSATSYNSSIRIQGLDGKYTQILRDGLPIYSGFSGGLSLLQIVPLDLRQVEVLKGASSTLYGGGAIAGLVNLISKVPEEERVLDFLFNGTSALGFDASGFYSEKYKKTGTTIFASYNSGRPYDPANIGLTAIPKFTRYTINPRLFLYLNEKTTLNIGFNSTLEDRIGGDIKYITGSGDSIHSYFEKNKTNRFSTQAGLDIAAGNNLNIKVKNSVAYYDRIIEIPDYIFSGIQYSSFSEASFSLKKEMSEWIGGFNLSTDQFKQKDIDSSNANDYKYITYGAFIQNTWNALEKFTLETGLRGDYHNEYGFFILPRISAMFKHGNSFSSRLGGGFGYKIPTFFTEDAERIQFRNVLPVNVSTSKAELSAGGNFDVNYRFRITEEISLAVNTLLFLTRVKDPLVLVPLNDGFHEFQQPSGSLNTKGIEVNLKLTYKNFKLFTGYTLADVKENYNNRSTEFPLVAKHRLNNILMYEIEEKLKIGFEVYYFSSQELNDGLRGKPYCITGLMIEKLWDHFSIFINFENFIDTRQTKFDTIYTGTITNPVFRDIYAPVDGFVVNAGIKLRI